MNVKKFEKKRDTFITEGLCRIYGCFDGLKRRFYYYQAMYILDKYSLFPFAPTSKKKEDVQLHEDARNRVLGINVSSQDGGDTGRAVATRGQTARQGLCFLFLVAVEERDGVMTASSTALDGGKRWMTG